MRQKKYGYYCKEESYQSGVIKITCSRVLSISD
jgi:hypothetical protein